MRGKLVGAASDSVSGTVAANSTPAGAAAPQAYTHPHRFDRYNFTTPSYCDICSNILWGPVKVSKLCAPAFKTIWIKVLVSLAIESLYQHHINRGTLSKMLQNNEFFLFLCRFVPSCVFLCFKIQNIWSNFKINHACFRHLSLTTSDIFPFFYYYFFFNFLRNCFINLYNHVKHTVYEYI
jgi:hypothetical protein